MFVLIYYYSLILYSKLLHSAPTSWISKEALTFNERAGVERMNIFSIPAVRMLGSMEAARPQLGWC